MRGDRRWLLAGICCTFALLTSLRAEDAGAPKPPEKGKPATEAKDEGGKTKHASLVAYPGAVIKAEDQENGIVVEVAENGKDLLAKKKEQLLWKAAPVGGNEIGTAVIRHVAIKNGHVDIVIGKHRYVQFDLTTGKMLRDISD